mgnify:CR=1 FL=1
MKTYFAMTPKRYFQLDYAKAIGIILVIILSFLLKNPIAGIFYKFLPFFEFKGVSAFNIILYEFIAFAVVFSILYLIFRVLVVTSSVFEKILKATIILGIPSKMLGAIVGLIEYLVIAYVALFFLNSPVLGIKSVNESKITSSLMTKSNILSTMFLRMLQKKWHSSTIS